MDPQEYQTMATIEDRHWWFCGRRAITVKLLKQFLPAQAERTILEIGCGTGGNLPMLARFGRVFAVEPSAQARTYAEQSGLATIRAGNLPATTGFDDTTFDTIFMTDVLEHIDDDAATLRKIKTILKPDGILFLTVPAYRFLWSSHDEALHHKRRYTRHTLLPLLAQEGFTVRYSSYFNTFLFPPAFCVRLWSKLTGRKSKLTKPTRVPPAWLNRILLMIFAGERHFLGKISFPFGLSLVVVATPES